jgi:hypothetical protein
MLDKAFALSGNVACVPKIPLQFIYMTFNVTLSVHKMRGTMFLEETVMFD